MRVKALKLRDRDFGSQWKDEIEGRWNYADFLADPAWRKDWISFDCLCHDPATDTVFCGITSFDLTDESFEVLGPVKDSETGEPAWQIHDICPTPDGTLYAGENDHPRRSSYLWEITPD